VGRAFMRLRVLRTPSGFRLKRLGACLLMIFSLQNWTALNFASREKSFFGAGMVAHVSVADPVCERIAGFAAKAAKAAGASVHQGGTYLAMEGPQFSTKAESHMYRAWGCDVIGMTNMPEAKLAREAELPYATVAMVTDFDCWHEAHGNVDVAAVIAVLMENANKASNTVKEMVKLLKAEGPRVNGAQGIETNVRCRGGTRLEGRIRLPRRGVWSAARAVLRVNVVGTIDEGNRALA